MKKKKKKKGTGWLRLGGSGDGGTTSMGLGWTNLCCWDALADLAFIF